MLFLDIYLINISLLFYASLVYLYISLSNFIFLSIYLSYPYVCLIYIFVLFIYL